MRGRGRPGRKLNYNGNEIEKANYALTQAVDHGTLRWLKTKLEHYPIEAVPNLWEGDEGMMKHVPKFPMPPLIALPEEQSAAEQSTVSPGKKFSDDGPEGSEMSDEGDLDIPKPSSEGDAEPKFKKHAQERYFWKQMAKVFMKLETINQSIIRARTKLFSDHETVRRQTCQQLTNLYKQLKVIKGKLDVAEKDYKTNDYMNLFKVMSLSAKLKFKRYHNIEGKLPGNMRVILKKHNTVRGKIRDILHKHSQKLLPFKDVLSSTILDITNKTNEKDMVLLKTFGDLGETENGSAENAASMDVDKAEDLPVSGDSFVGGNLLSDDDDEDDDDAEFGEGKLKKRKSVGADGVETDEANGNAAQSKDDTEATGVVLSKEEIFWKSMQELKRRINNTVITLSKVDKLTLPESTKRLKKTVSMSCCKQLLFVHRKVAKFSRSLIRLKEDMQNENYEDKKLFTIEDLTSQGIEDLTTDNSLAVIEALLNKLKVEYCRVRGEKREILERFGYNTDLDVANFPIDKNVQLVRVCAHSKTDININSLYANEDGSSNNNQTSTGDLDSQNEAGQEIDQVSSLDAGTDAQQNVDGEGTTGTDTIKSKDDVSVGENTAGANVDDTGDVSEESEPEDSSGVSKNVNSFFLSFFVKNLGPDAFSVSEPISSEHVSEDFIEKEKQHWNRLQKLLRKIDRAFKQVRGKGRNSYRGKKQMKMAVHSMCNKMKEFSRAFELEKTESNRHGYCKQVTYQNLEFQSQSSAKLLIKSLDQIKDRLDNLYGNYKETARRLGLLHMLHY